MFRETKTTAIAGARNNNTRTRSAPDRNRVQRVPRAVADDDASLPPHGATFSHKPTQMRSAPQQPRSGANVRMPRRQQTLKPREYQVPASKRRSRFRAVPEDVVGRILSFVEAPLGLCRCACVNKTWRRLADADELWEAVARTQRAQCANSTEPAASGGAPPQNTTNWKARYLDRRFAVARRKATQLRMKVIRSSRERSLKPITEALELEGWRVAVNGVECQAVAKEVWHFTAAMCFRITELPPKLQTLSAWQRGSVAVDCFSRRLGCRVRTSCRKGVGPHDWRTVADNGTVRLQQNDRMHPGRLWLGIWCEDSTVSFLLYSVPSHTLVATVESMTCFQATPCPVTHTVVHDDVDREYGLHDYTVTFTMRTPGQVKFEQQFPHLFTHPPALSPHAAAPQRHFPRLPSQRHGPTKSSHRFRFPLLTPTERGFCDWTLDSQAKGKRKRLKVHLPLRAGAFTTTIPQCTMVDVAVWDEHNEVMWAESALVHLQPQTEGVYYDLPNGAVFAGTVEEEGKGALYFEFVCPEGADGADAEAWADGGPGLVLYALHLDLCVGLVDAWFGTSYGA